jgi:hypothetical protein
MARVSAQKPTVHAPELCGRAIKPYSTNIIDFTIDIAVVVIAICKRMLRFPPSHDIQKKYHLQPWEIQTFSSHITNKTKQEHS